MKNNFFGTSVNVGRLKVATILSSIMLVVHVFAVTIPSLSFVLIISVPAFAHPVELSNVKKNIELKKSRWTAAENNISLKAVEDRKALLGTYKPDLKYVKISPKMTASNESTVNLGATFDWRSYNGHNFVTPARNQGNCGSCWAFAATAALESQILISENIPDSDLDLSEQTMVSCSFAGSCNGGYIHYASDYLKNTGLPLEYCFPYSGVDAACVSNCVNKDKISSWFWVTSTPSNVADIKTALAKYGPLVTTMNIYDDFFYYSSGIYTHTSGTFQGGHAILIVGFDDATGCFIAKNSWGKSWGEAGYFRISFNDVTNDVKFGDYTIAYQSNIQDSCTFSVSNTTSSSTYLGGSGSVYITTDGTCTWTAQSNVAWIKILQNVIDMNGTTTSNATKKSSGGSANSLTNITTNTDSQQKPSTRNGYVTYAVMANNSSVSRTGTISMAGKTFTVQQAGIPCTFSLSSTSASVAAAAATGSVSVTSPDGCAWTALSNAAWITITQGTTGSGNSAVSYSVAENASTSPRTGTITIAGKTFTIQQAAGVCSFTLASSSASFTSSSGTGSVKLTTLSGCPWTATSGASWITITQGSSGTSTGTISFAVAANTTTSARTGTLTIAGKTFSVQQGGIPCVFTLSGTSANFTSAGGTGSVGVTTQTGCAWTIASLSVDLEM